MSQRTLAASEVSQFAFCRRAWYYARQGEASLHQQRLHSGERWHASEARRYMAAGCLRLLGYGLLVAAAVLAAALLTVRLVS